MTPNRGEYWPFAAFLQGNSAIRTAAATSCSPDGGQGADLAIFPGI